MYQCPVVDEVCLCTITKLFFPIRLGSFLIETIPLKCFLSNGNFLMAAIISKPFIALITMGQDSTTPHPQHCGGLP